MHWLNFVIYWFLFSVCFRPQSFSQLCELTTLAVVHPWPPCPHPPGYVFCMLHRLPEQHECLFDHLGRGRQEAVLKMVKLDRKVGRSCQRIGEECSWAAVPSEESQCSDGVFAPSGVWFLFCFLGFVFQDFCSFFWIQTSTLSFKLSHCYYTPVVFCFRSLDHIPAAKTPFWKTPTQEWPNNKAQRKYTIS